MSYWIELPECPLHLEGHSCWRWIEGKGLPPVIDQIPRDFSRDRHHCGGIWVWPIVAPTPPEIDEVEIRSKEQC